MHYLKEEPFLDLTGKPLVIRDEPADPKAPAGTPPTPKPETTSSLYRLLLESYQPSQEFKLANNGEVRLLNKVIDLLEKPPFVSGCFAIEDTDWAVCGRWIKAAGPGLLGKLTRLAPAIEDGWEKMPTKEPATNAPQER